MDLPVSVRDVSKTFGGRVPVNAVRGISLDLRGGEVSLLVGPSGSGKTTLLSMIGCILRPTSGSIRILGREITILGERQLPAFRLHHVGFIFQAFRLFPTLTASENVELVLELKGARENRRRARELLDEVGLDARSDFLPADLSGGEQQRVAIARALAANPDIILADEPTAALDSASGRAIMEMLRGLARKQGRAVAIVTHDHRMTEFADRVLHIEDGRLLEAAVPQEAGRA